MAFVDIDPGYRHFLTRQGLVQARDFLQLAGIIYWGHCDRCVMHLTVGKGKKTVPCFLKREQRVRWRDRLASFLAGFGWVSKSRRELAMGRLARAAGISCPEMLAAGEEGTKAFLLVRAVENGVDLRTCLQIQSAARKRRQLARALGEELARIHAAGLDHPDLYSKHILVQDGETPRFWFLDWQRSRQRRVVGWNQRYRDLAALDATLAEELIPDRDRLECLHAYLRWSGKMGIPRLARAARQIRRKSQRLQRRRRIRELRQPPLPPGQQNLIRLNGEALYVTREFRDEFAGHLPSWVPRLAGPVKTGNSVKKLLVPLPEARTGHLVQRRVSRFWPWLWRKFRRRPLPSPELEEADTLFRLQRYRIPLPRLLAVGQRRWPPWRSESFLLTEIFRDAVPLKTWLAESSSGDLLPRREVLRQTGELLRRLHDAGYFLGTAGNPGSLFGLRLRPREKPNVVLLTAGGLQRGRQTRPGKVLADFGKLLTCFSGLVSRTDQLRFLLGYCDGAGMNPDVRQWVFHRHGPRPVGRLLPR